MQKKLLDNWEKILRKTGFSDAHICKGLRAFHIFFPNLAAFFIFFGSKRMFKITVFANVIIFLMFNCFHGCILSKLERRFCDDDFTVMDPSLNFLNIPTTHENRYKYSIYSALTCFIGTGIIYYLRFVYKWEERQGQKQKQV